MLSMSILIRPAEMFPTVDNTCNMPSAPVRELFGTVSAINATARPNTPPTPMPVNIRSSAKSIHDRLKKVRPVQME